MARAQPLRILHAIHDFLPVHMAGSELYAADLCECLSARGHHVAVLCAEYDPARQHGQITWRAYRSLPVVEVVNNWVCGTFADSYRSPLLGERLDSVLHAIQPDLLHIHSLLNLSFDLPALAHARHIPVVATLHDYSLVCPSGGQRVHRREQHICREIDETRCARCFGESPFGLQAAFGPLARRGGAGPVAARVARSLRRHAPALFSAAVRHAPRLSVTPADITERLARARDLYGTIDLFVSPSRSLADEFRQLGMPSSKVRVSDIGFGSMARRSPRPVASPLRIGFVGTLVWHKGVHLLIDAVRRLPPSSCELLIFGDTTVFPDYVADLRRQSAGLPVTFSGPFDPGQIADVCDRFDVLVVPSLWLENSPRVIHEAFMADLPVVAARIGGIPEFVTDGRNGFLYEPTDAGELAAILQRFVDVPGLAAELGAAPSPVKSLDADADEWENVYSEVLERFDARKVTA